MLNTKIFTEKDGRQLAVKMLKELRDAGADECSIEPQYWEDGATQNNVVQRYLNTIRRHDSPELEVGFTALLSDFIASGADPDLYERLERERPIDGSVAGDMSHG